MGDMGVNPCRKGWNLLAEVFAPYSAEDYADLFPSGDAAEMEARRGFSSKAPAIVLVMALVVALALIAIGCPVQFASILGVAVLAAPTLFDVARKLSSAKEFTFSSL